MAFNIQAFKNIPVEIIRNDPKGEGYEVQEFAYQTEDNIATIKAANYFSSYPATNTKKTFFIHVTTLDPITKLIDKKYLLKGTSNGAIITITGTHEFVFTA